MNVYKIFKKIIKQYSLLIAFVVASLAVLSMSFYTRVQVAYFVDTSERNVKDKLRAACIVLARMVEAGEINSYREATDVKRPEYMALRKKLVDFAMETNVLYAYYMRVEGDKVQYIIDNDFNDETRVGIDTSPEELDDYQELWPALHGKVHISDLGIYVKNWDGLISGYAPIFGKDGKVTAIAGVDINDKEMVHMRELERKLWFMQLASFVIVFSCGMYGFFRYRREARTAKSADPFDFDTIIKEQGDEQ